MVDEKTSSILEKQLKTYWHAIWRLGKYSSVMWDNKFLFSSLIIMKHSLVTCIIKLIFFFLIYPWLLATMKAACWADGIDHFSCLFNQLSAMLSCWSIGLSQPESAEKAMATHSSTLAWKIPWTEEPGRLQSMGSLRVRHDWVTSLSFFISMHWRRKWQPTPVFLPGEPQGRRSLVGCCLWGCTESDMTEVT